VQVIDFTSLKKMSSRSPMERTCSGQLRLPFAAPGEPQRAFWQARFYDFNVYSRGKKREKLNYMHANPVKPGLVNHPRDWAWSS
jgi:REP element-mobilizing transposase RayT